MKKTTLLSTLIFLILSCLAQAQQKATPVAKIRIENGKIVSFENNGSYAGQNQMKASDTANSTIMTNATDNQNLNNPSQTTGSMIFPDLTGGIEVADGTGPDIKYRYNVLNQGTATANNFHVHIVLSVGTHIGDSDDILIKDKVLSLTSGQAYSPNYLFADVGGVDAGTYFMGIFVDALKQISESNEGNNTAYDNYPRITIEDLPDLVITSFSINEIRYNSHEINTTFTIKNQGNKNIYFYTDRLKIGAYLSADKNINKASDYFFDDTYSSSKIDRGESTSRQVTFSGGGGSIPKGDYWMGLYLDYTKKFAEQRENNNTGIASNMQVSVPAAKPDLTWDENGCLFYSKDAITFEYYSIKNTGWSSITKSFSYRFILSTDKVISKADQVLKEDVHTSGLTQMDQIGICTSGSTKEVPTNSYYLIMQVDQLNQISELSESNNTWITAEQADIIHLNLTYPNGGETWVKGNPYTVRWTTEGRVSKVDIKLYKGLDVRVYFAMDISNTGSCEVTYPECMEDSDNFKVSVSESGNPCRSEDFSDGYFTIQTTAPTNPQPDLTVHTVEVLDSEGPEIGYKATIKNQGDASAGQSTAKFYLSSDKQINSSDYHLHSWNLTGSLSAGNSKNSGEITTTVSGVPAGEYYLGIIADAGEQVSESNENNNKAYDDSPKVTIPESSGGHWADIDGDGDVDAIDIQLVAACWNTQEGDAGYKTECDVDNDGDVDAIDIQLVAGWWNKDIGN